MLPMQSAFEYFCKFNHNDQSMHVLKIGLSSQVRPPTTFATMIFQSSGVEASALACPLHFGDFSTVRGRNRWLSLVYLIAVSKVSSLFQFSQYIKNGLTADGLEEMYTKCHAAIRKDPTPKKKVERPADAKVKRCDRMSWLVYSN